MGAIGAGLAARVPSSKRPQPVRATGLTPRCASVGDKLSAQLRGATSTLQLVSANGVKRHAKLSVHAAVAPPADDKAKGADGPNVPPPSSGPSTIVRINPEVLAAGGLPVASQPKAGRDGFGNSVATQFLPINMEFENLSVLNLDPPIFSIKNFISEEDCDVMVQAAQISKKMEKSATGGGAGLPADMRTSTSLALNQEVFAAQPKLRAKLDAVLAKARQLVAVPSEDWDQQADGSFKRPSGAGAFAFELPQIARYAAGQHFLAHEDAFPMDIAKQKGYQRRATLLLYLNDVPEGGATKFDIVDLPVAPVKGDALLFFPSFQNGIPDHRTLHTAEDAVEGHEKWVSQIWVSWGLPNEAEIAEAKAAAATKLEGATDKTREKKKRGTRGFGNRKAAGDRPKGFGSKK